MEEKTPEAVLNLLEMVVRCYDCCLSCSAFMVVVDEDDKVIAKRDFVLGAA
ncbi:MAG: hypothetical protein HXY34_10905 [Candidatus Thorarchaeota archaeon]|nr:hypothetical protein [Candidatus Thorarchaeota archaeon]